MSDLSQLTRSNLGGLEVSKVTETKRYANILIYGNAGVGKTRLMASASAVAEMSPMLVIDIEGGLLSVRDIYPDIDVVRVHDWDDMQKVYDSLYDGDHPYKTVGLDSLTEIQKFSMYNIMEELVKKEKDRDPDIPSVREWGKNIEQIRRLVRAFRDLPLNTIFTALVVQEKNARTGATLHKPSLSGKLSGEVAGFLDIVSYMYTKAVDGEVKRLLLTSYQEDYVAKDRTNRLPTVIESPTMTEIAGYINKPTSND